MVGPVARSPNETYGKMSSIREATMDLSTHHCGYFHLTTPTNRQSNPWRWRYNRKSIDNDGGYWKDGRRAISAMVTVTNTLLIALLSAETRHWENYFPLSTYILIYIYTDFSRQSTRSCESLASHDLFNLAKFCYPWSLRTALKEKAFVAFREVSLVPFEEAGEYLLTIHMVQSKRLGILICRRCRQDGHVVRECTLPDPNMKCERWGELGRPVKDCTQIRARVTPLGFHTCTCQAI